MSTRSLALALLALSSLGTGCARYTPTRLSAPGEQLGLAARTDEPIRLARTSRTHMPAAWIPLVTDVVLTDGLTLAEAGTVALTYAPDILLSRSEARIKGAQLLQAGRLGDIELFVGPRVGLEDGGFVLPGSLSFQIPIGDELEAERGHAGCDLERARLEIMAVELETLVAVREGFIEIAALQSRLATQRVAIEKAEGLLAYVERLGQAGEADPVTVHLARLERDEAEGQLEEATRAIPVRRAALLSLIGLMPSASIEIIADDSNFQMPLLPGEDPNSVLSHPRLQTAAAAYRTADQAARLATARQNPTLGIGPDFESDRGDLELGAGLGVSVPNPGRAKARVREAVERRRAARQAYQRLLLSLSRQAAESRAELASLDRLLTSQGVRIEGANRAEDALNQRTEAGLLAPVEALAARSSIARARMRELDLIKRRALETLRAAYAGGLLLSAPTTSTSSGGSD